MPVSVTLPALGESVTEGTVTRWLKQVGDTVETDEPLLEVSTDKVDTEIPSPASGVLQQITVGEDETVAIGAELAVIAENADAGQAAPAQNGPAQTGQAPSGPAQSDHAAPIQDSPAPPPPVQDTPPASTYAQQPPAAGPTDTPPANSTGNGSGAAGEGISVTLPALGESVTEGTVTRWLKQVGDTVETDEPLLEVSTDKVDTEIPSPASGTLTKITAGEDETVEVGAELGVIGAASGAGGSARTPDVASSNAAASNAAPSDAAPRDTAAPRHAAPAAPTDQPPTDARPAGPTDTPPQQLPPQVVPTTPAPPNNGGGAAQYVTPLVRKLAAEHAIDLNVITGTGVGGRIRKQDVLDAAKTKAAAAPAPAAAPAQASPSAPAAPAPSTPVAPSPLRGTTEKLPRIRKIIAERMVEALQTSAQLTTVVEVDVTTIARLRDRIKRDFVQREGVKISFLPFFAKAAIDALKEHPKLNASIDMDAGEIAYHASENLILAVDTERGLMVPVIHNAGDLSVTGLAKRIADLAERTRTNKVGPDELRGGTFTLTNTGSRGALFDTPILTPPQVAMLGTGAVVKRPVVIDTAEGETIAIRHMVYLALSYDHRLIDGADAARYLTAVKRRLEDGSVGAEFS